jgi:hypothetical protein
MANVTVEPKSEYTSETVNDTILYIKGGMQGPYTVCKELPAKGASNAARTPNIEGRLKGERKAGPSAALGIPPSTLPGGWGNTPPGATTHRWEIGLWNLHARRSLRDRRRGQGHASYMHAWYRNPETPLEGDGLRPRVPVPRGSWASGRRMGPWVGGIHTGRACGACPPLVTE